MCGTKVAGRTDSNAADVVRCLNSLTSLDMRSIASDDVLTSLVTDYFVTRQIGNTDDDSESDSSDDVDIDPPVVDIVGGEVNSGSESSASDGADRSGVFLAYGIRKEIKHRRGTSQRDC